MSDNSKPSIAKPENATPAVSIVIPAYNAMAYLQETLDSVWEQTFTDFEVIVVDDGSTDCIQEWFETTPLDSRLRLISQENQGSAGARNTGIQESRADYVAFLDADDLWAPTKLERQMNALERSPDAALVYTWSTLTNAAGVPTGRIFKSDAQGQVWADLILNNFVGCGSTPVVKRSYIQTLGAFDQSLGSAVEDWEMWLRLALKHPFLVVSEPLVKYRQHEISASRNWRNMEQGFKTVLEKAFAEAKAAKMSNLTWLRQRAYGNVYLDLAWKPLQCEEKDIAAAKEMLAKAVKYDSQIWQTTEYWRLSLAINLMQTFGETGYRRILQAVYSVRRFTSTQS